MIKLNMDGYIPGRYEPKRVREASINDKVFLVDINYWVKCRLWSSNSDTLLRTDEIV